MKNPVQDQMMNMSDFYTGTYTQVQPAPQQESTKPRRRRKKTKGDQKSEGVPRKRKLTEEQVRLLEFSFGTDHKLESERKERIASELGLEPVQVAVWFQNRRARWKSQKMEEEYSKLKTEHETAVLDKCRLEMEVLKLKEKLSDAEKEIQILFKKSDGVYGNSPTSSFSMEATDPQLFGDFGMDGIDNIFYVPDNYTNQGYDWVDSYV